MWMALWMTVWIAWGRTPGSLWTNGDTGVRTVVRGQLSSDGLAGLAVRAMVALWIGRCRAGLVEGRD